eukprot:6173142-Pleurochrysis_carterae.AAC.1
MGSHGTATGFSDSSACPTESSKRIEWTLSAKATAAMTLGLVAALCTLLSIAASTCVMLKPAFMSAVGWRSFVPRRAAPALPRRLMWVLALTSSSARIHGQPLAATPFSPASLRPLRFARSTRFIRSLAASFSRQC